MTKQHYLKINTINAIDTIKKNKRISEKEAAKLLFNDARKRRVDTGFQTKTLQNFYYNIKKFRQRYDSKMSLSE